MTPLAVLKEVWQAGGMLRAEDGRLHLVCPGDQRERLARLVKQADRAELVAALTPPPWAGAGCWPVPCGKRIGWRIEPRPAPYVPLGVPEHGPCGACGRETSGMVTRPDRTWDWLCAACADAMAEPARRRAAA